MNWDVIIAASSQATIRSPHINTVYSMVWRRTNETGFFFIFSQVMSKSEIIKRSRLISEINSIFNVKNIEFLCLFSLVFEHVFFSNVFHDVTSQWLVIFTLWKKPFLIFPQCENHSIWRYHFYSTKKKTVFHGWKFWNFYTVVVGLVFLKPGFTLSYNHSMNMLRIVYPYCCINIMNSILVYPATTLYID